MAKNSPKKILDRLDNRISKGFGDYTAIKTVTWDKGRTLGLYCQYGKASLWYGYMVADPLLPKSSQPNTSSMSTPKNWPKPDLKDVLQHSKGNKPDRYYVTDGEHVWSANANKGMASLPNEIWFGTKTPLFLIPGTKVKLTEDINRPGLIGICVEKHFPRCDYEQQMLIELIISIEPERDDMPVEILVCRYDTDEKILKSKSHTKYLDYAQLPNGKWYPTRWQGISNFGKNKQYLQIFQDMKLDKSWFNNPEG